MNLRDPRVGTPLIFALGGMLLYVAVIGAGLSGEQASDRQGAWLLLLNAGVGIGIAVVGRLRPAAIATALGAMVLGEALITLLLVRAGTGTPAIIFAVHVVLAVPFFLGFVLALVLQRASRRAANTPQEKS